MYNWFVVKIFIDKLQDQLKIFDDQSLEVMHIVALHDDSLLIVARKAKV